jgi:hypothetical protein
MMSPNTLAIIALTIVMKMFVRDAVQIQISFSRVIPEKEKKVWVFKKQ